MDDDDNSSSNITNNTNTNTNSTNNNSYNMIPREIWDVCRGGSRNFGGGSRLKSRLFTKDVVTAERIEFKIIEPINYWASEASPTLGCSIEISRDIYMYIA